jgi:hypothetical protein
MTNESSGPVGSHLHSRAGKSAELCGMAPRYPSPQHVKRLRSEVAALSTKHVDALKAAIYLGMNRKEADEYDQAVIAHRWRV